MATNRIGTVALMLTANAQGVATGVSQAQKAIAGIGTFANRTFSVFTGNLMARGFSTAIEGAKELAKWAAETAMEYEQAEIAFQVMTGSKAGGTKLLNDLQKLAVETPFKSSEVVAQAKLLKAYGVDTEDLITTISRLGDVAAGTGVDIGRLSLAYGQVISKGRFQASELRQFTEAGAGVAMFAKAANMSSTQFLAAMEAGKIGSDIVVKAFEQATQKGGMFFRLMEKQSQTVKGRFDSFIESFEILIGKVGLAAFKAFGIAAAFDSWAKAIQAMKSEGLAEWLEHAAVALSPLKNGITGLAAALREIFGGIKDAAPTWGELQEFLQHVVDVGVPAVIDMSKEIAKLGLVFSQAALDGLKFVSFIDKLIGGMNKLAFIGSAGFFGKMGDREGIFGAIPGAEFAEKTLDMVNKRPKEIQDKLDALKSEFAGADAKFWAANSEGPLSDAAIRTHTGYVAELNKQISYLENQTFSQRFQDRGTAVLSALDDAKKAAADAMAATRGNIGGTANDARGGVIGGLLFGGMKADELAEEASAAARIAGEKFEKSFMQGAELIAPGFKRIMDGVVADAGTAGEQLRQSMEAISLGEAVQRIGAGAAARQRVAAFEAFKKATGVGEIRNTAPLLETGSQAAYSALNAARGVGTGSTVEDIIKQGNAIAEQTAKNTAETARQLKDAFKPNPVSTVLAIKFGGG